MILQLTGAARRPGSSTGEMALSAPARPIGRRLFDLTDASWWPEESMASSSRPFRQLMAGQFIDGSPLPRRLRAQEVTGLALLYVQELDDQLVELHRTGGRVRAVLDRDYNAVVLVSGSVLTDEMVLSLRVALRRANKMLYEVLADIDHFAAAGRAVGGL
jgi:hypothetical protein